MRNAQAAVKAVSCKRQQNALQKIYLVCLFVCFLIIKIVDVILKDVIFGLHMIT